MDFSSRVYGIVYSN